MAQPRHKRERKTSEFRLEELEPRVLFSADLPFATLGLVVPETTVVSQQSIVAANSTTHVSANETESIATNELVIIDSNVSDIGSILDDIKLGSLDDTQFVILDDSANSAEDVLSQLSEILASHQNIQAVHLVSHGASGELSLGGERVDTMDLLAHTTMIERWGDSFVAGADFLIYGCDVAAGARGEAFVEALSILSGADVAASSNLTGGEQSGGDWNFEVKRGEIQHGVVFSENLQKSYKESFATYTVSTLADSGTGSLREAIGLANGSGTTDVIQFGISGTISLASLLPTISDTITIDGTTAPGYVNSPVVTIDGNLIAGADRDGLSFTAGSDNSVVRGIGIVNFSGHGIELTNSGSHTIESNYIGTDGTNELGNDGDGIRVLNSTNNIVGSPGAGNVISGNTGVGVHFEGASTSGNTVQGNYIGTDASGAMPIPNFDGVLIDGSANNKVGGNSLTGEGNLISGNSNIGIYVDGAGASGNIMAGNFIGTNASGSAAIANGYVGIGIVFDATDNLVGGSVSEGNLVSGNTDFGISVYSAGIDNIVSGNTVGLAADGITTLGNGDHGIAIRLTQQTLIGADGSASIGNVISGNGGAGVWISGLASSGTSNNTIAGNFIGTDSSGQLALGNSGAGVLIVDQAHDNLVGGTTAFAPNFIRANDGAGIVVADALTDNNSFRQNSITANGGLGIDLNDDGVTANDAGDTDDGGNKLQNGAVINSVSINNAGTFSYDIDTTTLAAGTYTVEFYASSDRNSGRVEGERYIGLLTGVANGNSSFSGSMFGITLSPGEFVTTVTTDSSGNSSEFSTYAYVADGDGDGVSPEDIKSTFSMEGGLSINDDGGNDIYLKANDGDALLGGLSSFSFESQFATTSNSGDLTLLSYAVSSNSDEINLTIRSDGDVEIFIAGDFVRTSAFDFGTLRDGSEHTVGLTWDGSTGNWEIYVDGVLVDSSTISAGLLLSNGETIEGHGVLLFGQEQDSVEGDFSTSQEFAGTLYNIRLFNGVRTDTDMAASYRSELPFDEPGMLAQWNLGKLSVDGVITDSVNSNNLIVKHTSEVGFTTSTASLTLALNENSVDGSIVGTVIGVDPQREAQITSLLVADPNLHYSAETGKFYKVNLSDEFWADAETLALSTTLSGVPGQLVTIYSAHDNQVVRHVADSAGVSAVWIGATDQSLEADWRWRENGNDAEQFWNGDENGNNPTGAYNNWLAGEPNGAFADEHFARMNEFGFWVDARSSNAHASVIEWNADAVLDVTQPIAYSIQSQTVAGAFTIDADTGEISVLDGILLDADTQAIHTIIIRASDAEGIPNTQDKAFSISLKNLAENDNGATDLSSGVELNHQNGNDAYLVANDGGAVLGGLTSLTFETTFHTTQTRGDNVLIDYGTSATDDAFRITIKDYGDMFVEINGSSGSFSGNDYSSLLLDGQLHHFAFSWDSTNGDVAIYIDGELIESNTSFFVGQSVAGGSGDGGLLFGQDQNTTNGTFNSEDGLNGSLYEIRLWDEVRSEAEISLNHQHKFDSGNIPDALIANWQMDLIGSKEVVDIVSGNNLSVANVGDILTWTNQVGGVTASGNTLTYVDDGAPENWGSQINSANMSALGFTDNYTIRFTLDNTTNYAWTVGLGSTESSADFSDAEYAIFVDFLGDPNDVDIRHNGTTVGTYDINFASGGEFGFYINGTTLEYQYDGVTFATDTIAASTDWYIDSAFYVRTSDATYNNQDDYSLSNFHIVNGNGESVTGFTESTPVDDLHINENASNGDRVGFIIPSNQDAPQDVVSDGLFLESTPITTQNNVSGSFGNWTVTQENIDIFSVLDWKSPLGGRVVGMDGTSPGGIAQTINTTVGQQYQVVFALSGDFSGGDSVKDLRVSANGASQDYSIEQAANWSWGNTNAFEHRSFTFTASDTSTLLQFMSLEDQSSTFGPYIADISVIEITQNISTVLNNDPTLAYDAATGKFYRYVSTTEQFADAIVNAQNESINGVGGQLATIYSAYENALVASMITNDVWLGGADTTVEGEWTWLDGNSDSDLFWTGGSGGNAVDGVYTNFTGAEPNNRTDISLDGEDALMMSSPDGRWYDSYDASSVQLGYVIEWDANDVLSNYIFSLIDDAGGRFTIDADSGEVTVADSSLLEYEVASFHDIDVSVIDAAGNSYTKTKTITVDNVQEVVQNFPATLSLDEDTTLTFTSGTSTEVSVSDKVGITDLTLRVSLSVSDGVLNLSQTTGLTFFSGATNSSSLIIDGTESDVNAALDGMTFTPGANFNGTVTLDMSTDRVLFHDSFDRPDNEDINDSTQGQSGALGNLNWIEVSDNVGGGWEIDANGLSGGEDGLASSGETYGYLNHNFVDSEIVNAGGFSISLDLESYITDGSGRSVGIAVGNSNAELSAWDGSTGGKVISDLLVGYRWTTTDLEIFDDGVLVNTIDISAYPTNQTIRVDYSLSDFDSGSTVDYEIYLSDDLITSGSFTWSGSNDNYIGIYSNLSSRGAEVDNLSITLPLKNSDTATITVGSLNDAPSFNAGGGFITTDIVGIGTDDEAHAVLALPDGQYLVSGIAFNATDGDFFVSLYNADGSLDTSFGTGGSVILDQLNEDSFEQVTVQPDGKIIAAGTTNGEINVDAVVVRLNADGSLDTEFGGGDGIATYDSGTADSVSDVVVLPNEKILLLADTNSDLLILQFNADGTFDTSFGGGDGVVTTDVAGSSDRSAKIAVQKDGKFVIGSSDFSGYSAVRYNADGTVDTTFGGGDGIATATFGVSGAIANSMALSEDGSIIVGGRVSNGGAGYDYALVKFDSTGAIDTSFGGGDGIAIVDNGEFEEINDLKLQSDGKIVAVGQSADGSLRASLVRFNTDGSLDGTFASGGELIFTRGTREEYFAIDITADDKIIVVGVSNDDTVFARYNADGTPDGQLNAINTLDGNPTFIEDGSAVTLDGDVEIFDEELSAVDDFDGATLTLTRDTGADADDVFSATGNLVLNAGVLELSSTNVGSYTQVGGQLVITFGSGVSNLQVNEVMQSIQYSNSNDVPPAIVQIDWIFSDGNAGAQGSGGAADATGSTTVSITAANDAPFLDLDSNDSTVAGTDFANNWTEGAGPVLIADVDATLTDVDSTNLTQLTVTLANLLDNGNEFLSADTTGTSIVASYDGVTGVLTLSGSDTKENYQQVLRTVTYDNTFDHPNETVRTITVVTNDGTDNSNVSTASITVIGTAEAGVSIVAVGVEGLDAQATVNEQSVSNNGSYFTQSVAVSDDGSSVVVWTSDAGQDGDGDSIMARLFDSQGNPTGSEFVVNSTGAGLQSYPSVAMDASGNFIVVWSSEDQDGSGTGVYAQRFSNAGVALGSEFLVNSTTTGDQSLSSVTMTDNGDFVIAWSGNGTGDNEGVFAKRYDATGVAQGSEFRINETIGDDQDFVSLSSDGAGNFVATWNSRNQDGSGRGVYMHRFDSDGNSLGGEQLVNTFTTGSQWISSVAMNDKGEFAVVWRDDGQAGEIYLQNFNTDGSKKGVFDVQVPSTPFGTANYPQVAIDDDGNVTVVWQDQADANDYAIVARQFDSTGTPLGSQFVVNTHEQWIQEYPAIAMTGDGQFSIVFTDYDVHGDTEFSIEMRRFGGATTEAGGSTVFSYVLDTQPTADVTITLSMPDSTEGTLSVTTLTFTAADWNIAQLVTVTGVEDTLSDGHITHQLMSASVVSSDGDYNGLAVRNVNVVNLDNDPALDLDTDDSTAVGTDYIAAWTENGGPVPIIDVDATLIDPDSVNLVSVTVTLSNSLNGVNEVLAVDTTGTSIVSTYTSGTGVLLLSGAHSVQDYQQALRTVTYDNTSDNPDTSARIITFVANDGTNESPIALTTVGITARNDTPIITSDGGGSSTSVSADENQSSLTTVTAMDPDRDPALVFSVSGGSDQTLFDIVSNSGVISFNELPDYEVKNTYSVEVTVTDSTGLTDTQLLAVNINDVNEASVISGTFNGAVTERNPGNAIESTIGVISISDVDAGDLPYFVDATSIQGDNGYGVFDLFGNQWSYTLDQNTVQGLDAGDIVYDSTIFVATDLSTREVEVVITGTEDESVITGTIAGLVAEGNLGDEPTTTSGTVSIIDIDESDSPVFLNVGPTLGKNGYGVFTLINSEWTYTLDQSKVQELNADDSVTDQIIFTASDGSLQQISVSILGTADAAVIVSSGGESTATVSIDENQTGVATVVAVDVDSDDTQTFSITGGADQAAFAIDSNSGELALIAPPDHETKNSYEVQITVTDSMGLEDVQLLNVAVNNVNEAPTIDDVQFDIPVNFDGTIGQLTASDPDSGDTLVFQLITMNEAGESNGITLSEQGTLSARSPEPGVYEFDVVVKDAEGLEARARLLLRVESVDLAAANSVPADNNVDNDSDISIETIELETSQALSESSTTSEVESASNSNLEIASPEEAKPQTAAATVNAEGFISIENLISAPVREIVINQPSVDELTGSESGSAKEVEVVLKLLVEKLADEQNILLNSWKNIFGSSIIPMTFSPELIGQLDLMRSDVDVQETEEAMRQAITTTVGTVVTATLSVGFATWLVQSGLLFASALSTAPLWRSMDPMPILLAGSDAGEGNFSAGQLPDDISADAEVQHRRVSGGN